MIRRVRLLEAVLWAYSLSPWLIMISGIVFHLYLAVWNTLWILVIWLGASDIKSQIRDLEERIESNEHGQSIPQIIDAQPEPSVSAPTSLAWLYFIIVLSVACLSIVGLAPQVFPLLFLVLLFLSPYYALWRLRNSLEKEVGLSPLLHL
ncbi:MAG: hypothetical protein ACFFFC_16235 [Candidatus Thorarchaeota archaeon]